MNELTGIFRYVMGKLNNIAIVVLGICIHKLYSLREKLTRQANQQSRSTVGSEEPDNSAVEFHYNGPAFMSAFSGTTPTPNPNRNGREYHGVNVTFTQEVQRDLNSIASSIDDNINNYEQLSIDRLSSILDPLQRGGEFQPPNCIVVSPQAFSHIREVLQEQAPAIFDSIPVLTSYNIAPGNFVMTHNLQVERSRNDYTNRMNEKMKHLDNIIKTQQIMDEEPWKSKPVPEDTSDIIQLRPNPLLKPAEVKEQSNTKRNTTQLKGQEYDGVFIDESSNMDNIMASGSTGVWNNITVSGSIRAPWNRTLRTEEF